MSVKVEFKDKRGNYDKLVGKTERLRNSFVVIGVLEKSYDTKYPGPDSTSVGEVAFWNEFGTVNMPERPFMRSAFDTNKTVIDSTRDKLLGEIIDCKLTPKEGLTKLGFMMREFIQRRINTATSWATPLSPRTVAGKGSGKPLIDSGLLLRSIDFEVKE
jgi:hypothetical protein